ncbi:sugar ABC transporter substrate-binding protein [Paenibacillus aestuarii]|uniref:Sugar ABC transporter substrate-binding protein n=1 Tax=Paenibacillus aestuarii TaxID=516965 RepID=A0ABW0KAU7_9BACL|nr:sugar ABC transporter substrate-binding protein [Paenibacillus aestuarii]
MKKMLISMLAITTIIAAGCSSSPNEAAPAQGQGNATSTETVELSFSSWGGSAYKETNDLLIQAFTAKHPNIKVKIEDTPNKQYWQKMEAAASGENLPDVFWMNGPRFASYAANGMLKPLDDLIKQDNVDLKNYPESLVKLYNYNGKQYAIPKDFDTIGVWYNKALFDAKGVPYPDGSWNWEQFVDTAKKLTDPAKGVWGVAAALDSQGGYYNTIYQSGGNVISDDKKKSGYDSPEGIAGIKFWTDLINVHKVSPTLAQMTDTEPLDMFQSGKVAMLWEGSWNATTFAKNDYLKDKVDVAPLPKNKQQSVVIHGLGYAMSAKSQHPKEAWELLKFLGSKEAMDIHAKTGVAIPAFNGTQDVWVKSFPNMKLQIFIDEVKYAKPYPVSKYTSKWSSLEQEILNKAWAGQVSAEEAAKQLAAKMNEALAAEK